MVKTLDRLFDSFVSPFLYRFSHHQDNNRFSHHQDNNDTRTRRKMYNHRNISRGGRPLSLQQQKETTIDGIYLKKGEGAWKQMTVELKVRMCCTGCERVVKEAIHKLRGVDSVEVDLEMEKVTVIGYVDRNKVLKAVRRAGKRAEFWPYPNPPLYFTSTNNYFKDTTVEFKESYNYWRHGYNAADRHGALLATHRGDDKVSNMFNDDNVNACYIM